MPTSPLLWLHISSLPDGINTIADGSVTVAFAFAVHPFASVTVTLYAPAHNPEISSLVAELSHKYVSTGVPPAVVKFNTPSQPPLQSAGVIEIAAIKTGGSVSVTSTDATHPFASVTVIVCVPEHMPVSIKAVPPVVQA